VGQTRLCDNMSLVTKLSQNYELSLQKKEDAGTWLPLRGENKCYKYKEP